VLAAWAAAGADIQYILTGERSASALTQDERLLIEEYRKLDARGRHAALGAVMGLGSPPGVFEGSQQNFYGSVGQTSGRDIVNGRSTRKKKNE
jgi:hypothetical protein